MIFSIVVPVYNVEKYIDECISSILNQSFNDYELILVDDGSQDESGTICDKYAKICDRITVLHKPNEGLISARRYGIKSAKGKYCIFCDSDDYLEENALKELYNIINDHCPDVILYGAYVCSEARKTEYQKPSLKAGFITDRLLLYKTLFTTYSINSLCMKAIKLDVIDKEKDYTSYYECSYGEDLLQSIPVFIRAETIYYHPDCLYNYRYESGMMRKYNKNYYWSYKKVNNVARELLQNEDGYDTLISKYIDYHLLIAAYGGTTQYKYRGMYKADEHKEIAIDQQFREAYRNIRDNELYMCLNNRQKIVLFLLYTKRYGLLKMLLNFRRVK